MPVNDSAATPRGDKPGQVAETSEPAGADDEERGAVCTQGAAAQRSRTPCQRRSARSALAAAAALPPLPATFLATVTNGERHFDKHFLVRQAGLHSLGYALARIFVLLTDLEYVRAHGMLQTHVT